MLARSSFASSTEAVMHVIPERFEPVSAHIAHAGTALGFATAYALFALMFLLMLADLVFTVMPSW